MNINRGIRGIGRNSVNKADRVYRGQSIQVNRGGLVNREGRQRNIVASVQGVNSRLRPTISGGASPIVPQVRIPGQRMFSSRLSYINIVPHFHGVASEDPYSQLSDFSAICGSIGDGTYDQEEVWLRLFRFSLKDKVKLV